VTDEILASVCSALIVAVIWLARVLSKLSERVARLEGRLNGRH
jgi:hypothetical protein